MDGPNPTCDKVGLPRVSSISPTEDLARTGPGSVSWTGQIFSSGNAVGEITTWRKLYSQLAKSASFPSPKKIPHWSFLARRCALGRFVFPSAEARQQTYKLHSRPWQARFKCSRIARTGAHILEPERSRYSCGLMNIAI
jgi:hypothetical protein